MHDKPLYGTLGVDSTVPMPVQTDAYADANVIQDELVEYFDADNRPLLVSSQSMTSHEGLWRRQVGIIVYDMQRRVYVRCRKPMQGASSIFWDLSAMGAVHVGESSDEAAMRHVHAQLGDIPALVEPVSTMRYVPNLWFVSLYSLGPMHEVPHTESKYAGNFMTKHELTALHAYAPELCTPLLSWCLASNILWRT